MATLIAFLGIIAGLGALIAAESIWRGYVLSILWGWFMVPLFGLPALNIPYAIGITLVLGFLTHQSNSSDKEISWSNAFTLLVYPALVLLIGWVVTKFL